MVICRIQVELPSSQAHDVASVRHSISFLSCEACPQAPGTWQAICLAIGQPAAAAVEVHPMVRLLARLLELREPGACSGARSCPGQMHQACFQSTSQPQVAVVDDNRRSSACQHCSLATFLLPGMHLAAAVSPRLRDVILSWHCKTTLRSGAASEGIFQISSIGSCQVLDRWQTLGPVQNLTGPKVCHFCSVLICQILSWRVVSLHPGGGATSSACCFPASDMLACTFTQLLLVFWQSPPGLLMHSLPAHDAMGCLATISPGPLMSSVHAGQCSQ